MRDFIDDRSGIVSRLPAFLQCLAGEDVDDHSATELGRGDDIGAATLVAALREVVQASTPEFVVTAVARFVLRAGGQIVPATADRGTAIPLDLGLGTCAPLLAAAEPMSVARMRLEQYLPWLIEDARLAVGRLRHVAEITGAVNVDPLTGMASRRQFWRELATVWPGDAIVLVDIDHFKVVNDRHGHQAGDLVLTRLGETLLDLTRKGDCVGRYGGDEIVVLMRRAPVVAAMARIERARAQWSRLRPLPVTFSAGVAAVGDSGWEPAMRQADLALYEAKARGRDRVAAAGSP